MLRMFRYFTWKNTKKTIKNNTSAVMKERNHKEKTQARLKISHWLTLLSLIEPLLPIHRWGRQAECLTFPLFRHDACERMSPVALLSLLHATRLNSNQKSQSHCTLEVEKQTNREIKEDSVINPPALIQHALIPAYNPHKWKTNDYS